MRIATLFSGIGSPEQGARNVYDHFEIVFACEFDDSARKSYLANYEINKEHFHIDVNNLDATKYRGLVDILVGGSPCQSFSIAGLRNGTDDERGKLIYQYIRVVEECEPEIIVYENVRGMLNIDNGRTIKEFVQELRNVGYYCHYGIVNTKHYGVPQNRERLFLVGFKDEELYHRFRFSDPIPLKKNLMDILEEDVPEEYDIDTSIYEFFEDRIHIPSATVSGYEVARVGDSINISFPKTVTGRGKVGKQVSQALVTGNTMAVVESMERIRLLTPLERLRLHAFPDDFKIVVSKTDIIKQTGNTMSVNILEMIFTEIERAKRKERTNTLMDFIGGYEYA